MLKMLNLKISHVCLYVQFIKHTYPKCTPNIGACTCKHTCNVTRTGRRLNSPGIRSKSKLEFKSASQGYDTQDVVLSSSRAESPFKYEQYKQLAYIQVHVYNNKYFNLRILYHAMVYIYIYM